MSLQVVKSSQCNKNFILNDLHIKAEYLQVSSVVKACALQCFRRPKWDLRLVRAHNQVLCSTDVQSIDLWVLSKQKFLCAQRQILDHNHIPARIYHLSTLQQRHVARTALKTLYMCQLHDRRRLDPELLVLLLLLGLGLGLASLLLLGLGLGLGLYVQRPWFDTRPVFAKKWVGVA